MLFCFRGWEIMRCFALGPGKIYGQELDQGRLDLNVTHEKVLFRNVTAKQGQSTLSGRGWIQYNGYFEVDATSPGAYVQDISWARGHLPQVEAILAGAYDDRPVDSLLYRGDPLAPTGSNEQGASRRLGMDS